MGRFQPAQMPLMYICLLWQKSFQVQQARWLHSILGFFNSPEPYSSHGEKQVRNHYFQNAR